MSEPLLLLAGAVFIELSLGEPPARAHPVVWMGRAIRLAERLFFRGTRAGVFVGGVITVIGVAGLFGLLAGFGLDALRRWPVVYYVLGAFGLSTTFSIRALDEAARSLGRALAIDASLDRARHCLRSLCSRDASHLDERDLIAATIESVAENTNDSVVAPLFYWALFGVPGAVIYRAVNTLDAMIGYHGRYEYFGKAAARADDLLGWIPARLTALLVCVAGYVTRRSAANGWRVALSDHHRTESPNAGWPMAAMAGVLDVRLEKRAHYALGTPGRELGVSLIDEARAIMRVTAVLAVLLAATSTWAENGR